MSLTNIILICIYAVVLVCYFFIETRENQRRRMAVKLVLVALYAAVGIIGFVNSNFSVSTVLVLVSLAFTALGDALLAVKDDHTWLKRGAISFFVANLIIIAAQVYFLITVVCHFQCWWCFAVAVPTFGRHLVYQKEGKIVLEKDKIKMNIYVASVTLNGILGLSMAIYGATVKSLLWGIGCILFMVADYFLVHHKYGDKRKWQLIANSALYFSGLMFIALSIGF